MTCHLFDRRTQPGTPDYLNRPRTTLWSVATCITLGVYLAVALWLFQGPSVSLAEAAPAAMMIELAPVPVARAVEEDLQVAPDNVVQKQASAPANTPPKDVVKKTVPKEKPTDTKKAAPPLKDSSQGQRKQETQPASESQKQPKSQEEPPTPPPSPAASATSAPPKLDATPANTTAAAQSSRGSADPALKVQWEAQLLAHLERFKRYPSAARERGDRGNAYLRFEIDSNGQVLSASIVRSSGFTELDNATLDMISRASPVPRPPEGSRRRFTVPVVFAK